MLRIKQNKNEMTCTIKSFMEIRFQQKWLIRIRNSFARLKKNTSENNVKSIINGNMNT